MHEQIAIQTIKIWTFQETKAVDEHLHNGYLECNYSLACKDFRDVQYKWMILQMKKRLSRPDPLLRIHSGDTVVTISRTLILTLSGIPVRSLGI